MVEDICMVDIIEVDIIIITDEDIDLDTIITMDTDIIMDDVIEHNQDVMGIIEIKMIIETVTDTIRTTGTIKTISTTEIIIVEIEIIAITEVILQGTEIIAAIEVIIIELLDHVQQADNIDNSLRGPNKFEPLINHYPAIISKTFPTINPPNVPTMYPIIAMSTPIGIRALE